jgi:hypothetical protein
MRHALLGLVALAMAMPAWASGSWQVVMDTPAEVVAIDLSSFQAGPAHVSFRERRTLRGGQIDPGSLRPIREVLIKQMLDCRGRRTAMVSRAVFSDDDAMISYQAVQPRLAQWQSIAKDDPVYRLVCGHS